MYAGFNTNLYAASNKGVFRSTDNGNTWNGLTYAAAVTQTLNMLSVFEEPGIIYAGSDKRLYKSTDNGSTWSWVPLPIDSINVYDIQRSGSNLVIAYSKSFNKGGVFYSSNGISWTAASGLLATQPMYDLHVEADTVYVGGMGGVHRSVDKGMSFGASGAGLPNGRSVLRHSGKLFAGDAGGTGVYMSSDNGTNWSQANATVFAGFCQVFSMAQSPSMMLVTVDGGASCNGGNPIKSSVDGGINWSPYMTGVTSGFYPKVGTNAGMTSFFTSKGNKVYRTGVATGLANVAREDGIKAFFDQENTLVVKFANHTNVGLNIYSVNGELVYQGSFADGDIRITNMQRQPQGLYILTVSSGNNIRSCRVLKAE